MERFNCKDKESGFASNSENTETTASKKNVFDLYYEGGEQEGNTEDEGERDGDYNVTKTLEVDEENKSVDDDSEMYALDKFSPYHRYVPKKMGNAGPRKSASNTKINLSGGLGGVHADISYSHNKVMQNSSQMHDSMINAARSLANPEVSGREIIREIQDNPEDRRGRFVSPMQNHFYYVVVVDSTQIFIAIVTLVVVVLIYMRLALPMQCSIG